MVLYRMAGSPAGYGNGLFGTNDTVSREQIATTLWRYAETPNTNGDTEAFADASTISEWAKTAVEWARENNIING